ncbi:uncharacterized protein LOC123228802 [Mangifera indica]|uniref:uncharacterized protein LOC123228802 n=1 Tax=Mangifera indica TaxID=29780 RepID=UPI001CFBAD8F|nr:uncharacterized protein LOC123228802 [Mangifera indica]
MSTLSERVGVLEALVGEPAREGESLAEQGALHSEAIAELKQITRNLQKECAERYNEILSQILSLTDRMEERVATLEEDLKIAKKAIALAPSGGEMVAGQSKLKVPEPKPFGGSRNAKELENFLWDMDQYFKAARVAEGEQVTITAMYLAGDAKLWWRTRMEDDASAGRPKIESWEVLKRELKEQFLPQNSAWVARETLKKLKHTSSVREYVKEFSSLMLDIKNMSEEDKLFNFVSGLQPWAQAELRRQKVADLPSAVAAADGLVDYKLGPSSSNAGEKKKGRSERRRSPRKYGKEGWKDRRKREAEPSKQRGPDPTPSRQGGGCFLCAGPHRARDCPKREQLSALIAQEEKSTEDENPRLNPIQLLNAVTAEQPAACKGLMYAWAEVNGQQVRAMLDTGATNNFLAQRVVGKLGVTMEKCSSRIKAVNSASQPILGTAASRVKMGAWEGECTFMAVPLDDFDLILGLDFFVKAKAVAMPHLNGVMIMDEQQACFVKADANVRSAERVALQSAAQACAGLEHVALQSAAQVCAGLKRGEELVIAALVEIKEDHTMDVPDCIAEVLDRYADVMPAALPKTLPPKRRIDHKIELEPGARPPARAPYRMGPMELEELRKQLDELLDAGFIQPSKAPYGAPVLFQRKKDGTLRMCVDYRALNKVTIKNKYPIPNVADLFDRLARARYFTKLDLRSGYWQVRIAVGDEAKTTMVTRYGAYEFLVMPFGLTNAPATFCNLMNDVLYEWLDRFVVVYLDDIVIYSESLEDHVRHLDEVMARLRAHQLYVKKEKCEFCMQEIMFLGHKVSHGQIRMDERKVTAIVEWTAPTKVSELRSFLGLANYYRRFVRDYSKIVAPLTDLLKKDKPWGWTEECAQAFARVKQAVTTEPVLRLPDFTQPFEVHTDASDRALRGVLVQEKHPIAFESRKLKDAEQRYSAHEKEMTAVIHCLETWRHYLLGTKFTVVTDNVANTYFKTQKKLSAKQARWQEFLAEYDFEWVHRAGSENRVADALSRKEVHAYVAALTEVQSDFLGKLRVQAEEDAEYAHLREQVEQGVVRKYWLDRGLLYAKGGRLYVPKSGGLRQGLLKETHEPQWAGHPGVERMVALLKRHYCWPRLEEDVELYVRTCLVCQLDKTERQKQAGLLQPLPIPERPWESVSMDFVSGFPKVDGKGSVLVVVNRFSKYAVFIAAPQTCQAQTAAEGLWKIYTKLKQKLQATISMTKNPMFHGRTKHIELHHHFIQDVVAEGLIVMKYCSTNDQMADSFTKELGYSKFVEFRSSLGVVDFASTGDIKKLIKS